MSLGSIIRDAVGRLRSPRPLAVGAWVTLVEVLDRDGERRVTMVWEKGATASEAMGLVEEAARELAT